MSAFASHCIRRLGCVRTPGCIRTLGWIRTLGFSIAAVVLATGVSGDDQTTTGDDPRVDERAAEVLRAASDYFAGLEAFSLEAKTLMKMNPRGVEMEVEGTQRIRAHRPNRFAIDQNYALVTLPDRRQIGLSDERFAKHIGKHFQQ